jgi:UDP-glucose 4-epimerase
VKYFIAGGAGFIGSEMAHKLWNDGHEIIIYDNLSSGNIKLIEELIHKERFYFYKADIKDLKILTECMQGCDVVFHFASNADIAKAMSDPTIDFYEGTLLTQNILEAMRANGVKKIIYASGSGVYGRVGYEPIKEDIRSMQPVSTYGASKLAGEALISAYCWMFDIEAVVYRFANVIGKNSTHGVILDLINKLKNDSTTLEILGSGNQTKGYIYINDIINGILETEQRCDKPFDYFNLSPDGLIGVRNIADIIVEEMRLEKPEYKYKTDTRSIDGGGWRGDVAWIRMDSGKARSYGWQPQHTTEQAVRKSIREMLGKE